MSSVGFRPTLENHIEATYFFPEVSTSILYNVDLAFYMGVCETYLTYSVHCLFVTDFDPHLTNHPQKLTKQS